MPNAEIKTNIINVINTLNTVTIHGRENMNRLLGCIMVLEKMASDLDKPEAEPKIEILPMTEEAHDAEHTAD